MSFFWLAVKDLLLIGRDKKAFLTLIMMPLLLIAILGAAFGNVFQEEGDVEIPKFTLGIVNLDEGTVGGILADEVFGKALPDQIRVKNFKQDKMEQKIQDHKLSVGIVIPANFTTSLSTGKAAEIKLISVPNPGVKTMIIQSVIEQFTQNYTVETEAMKQSMEKALQVGMSIEEYQASMVAKTDQNAEENQTIDSQLNEKTVQAESKPVGSFQYYAAAMGVMFLLMTVAEGVSAMILEKEQEVYNRLQVSKLSYHQYLTGKMLGLITISLIQAFVIIIGTTLIFGVDWGDSVAGVIVITISFVISACGLGILAGSFIKKEKTFSVASMLATQIMAAIGGSMAPLYIFPDWAVLAGKFLPNGLALQTYIELMSGASLTDILPAVAGILGLGFVFFIIGLARLLFERRGSYA
ncbi:ABC transporter permease [Bacillus sp. T3]|uniref:ABC transporter permease n=1 Tax=Bacillus sp. T3 TaxID=467262 RepID=UPI0029828EC5|nr:ABC transporter permease [Bacillus sp. T3]